MNGYFLTGIVSFVMGIAIGGFGTHTYDAAHYGAQVAEGKVQLQQEKTQHANDLASISKVATEEQNRQIAAVNDAQTKLAALDAKLTQERSAHEQDNSRNRAAIRDGARRLRIAVSAFSSAGGDDSGKGASASSVGDGASGTAELSPAFGQSLFSIADDADSDARAKATYLQGYVCDLERAGIVSGSCGN